MRASPWTMHHDLALPERRRSAAPGVTACRSRTDLGGVTADEHARVGLPQSRQQSTPPPAAPGFTTFRASVPFALVQDHGAVRLLH